jgi:hypothetical protein
MLDKLEIERKLRNIYTSLAANTQTCMLPSHGYKGLYFLEDLLASLRGNYTGELGALSLEQLKSAMLGMPDLCVLKIFYPLHYSVAGFRPLLPDAVRLPSQSEIDAFVTSKRLREAPPDYIELPESGEICPSPFSPTRSADSIDRQKLDSGRASRKVILFAHSRERIQQMRCHLLWSRLRKRPF